MYWWKRNFLCPLSGQSSFPYCHDAVPGDAWSPHGYWPWHHCMAQGWAGIQGSPVLLNLGTKSKGFSLGGEVVKYKVQEQQGGHLRGQDWREKQGKWVSKRAQAEESLTEFEFLVPLIRKAQLTRRPSPSLFMWANEVFGVLFCFAELRLSWVGFGQLGFCL